MPYRFVNLMEAFFKIRIPSSQICLGLCQHRPQRVGHGLTMQLRLAMDSLCRPGWRGLSVQPRLAVDSLCSPGWQWTHCADQDSLGLMILLLQPMA